MHVHVFHSVVRSPSPTPDPPLTSNCKSGGFKVRGVSDYFLITCKIAHYLSNQYDCFNLPHSFFLLTDKCEFLPYQDHIVTMDKCTVTWPYIKCKH